jgi:hypothetical protein
MMVVMVGVVVVVVVGVVKIVHKAGLLIRVD